MRHTVTTPTARLRLVRDEGAPDPGARRTGGGRVARDRGGLAILVLLLIVNAIPVAGELARIGHWSPAAVGFAAGAMLLVGCTLWSELRGGSNASAARKAAT